MKFNFGSGAVYCDTGPRAGMIRYSGNVYVTDDEDRAFFRHARDGIAFVPEGEQFTLLAADDGVKTDLELTCTWCGEVLCDAEAGDGMDTLARRTNGHKCLREHTTDEPLTWAEICTAAAVHAPGWEGAIA